MLRSVRSIRWSLLSIVALTLMVYAGPAQAAGCPGLAPDDPCLTLTPAAGPVGTRVTISGRITHDVAMWRDEFRDPAYFVLYADFASGSGLPKDCELLVGADHGRIAIATDGTVTGSFTVGSTGDCFQDDSGEHPVQPARYILSVGCHACGVADFTVTRGSLPFTGSARLLASTAVGFAASTLGVFLVVVGRRRPRKYVPIQLSAARLKVSPG